MKKISTHGCFKGGKIIHTLRFQKEKNRCPKSEIKNKIMTFKRTFYRHITFKKNIDAWIFFRGKNDPHLALSKGKSIVAQKSEIKNEIKIYDF
jgi:hypothetical protein